MAYEEGTSKIKKVEEKQEQRQGERVTETARQQSKHISCYVRYNTPPQGKAL